MKPNHTNELMPDVILRLPEVKRRTGKSRSSIYLDISKGIFPQSITIGSRSVGWLESDIQQWIDMRKKGGC